MKSWRLKEITWIGFFGAVAWIVFAPHTAAAGLAVPGGQAATTTSPDVATLLAPMVAASTSIERIIEMLWNYFESAAQHVAAGLGLGQTWAAYVRGQIVNAEAALNSLAKQALEVENRIRTLPPRPAQAMLTAPGTAPTPAAHQTEQTWLQALAERANIVKQLDDAQSTLKDAQTQQLDALNSQRYRSIKQSLSVLLGLGLGLAMAFATNLNIFQLLGLSTTAGVFGVFVTGLIIGAGTGPVHSLIGILQQSRDTLDQAANLFSSRARKNVTEQYTSLMQVNATLAAQPATAEAASRDLAPVQPTDPTPTQQQLRTIERLARR